MNPVLILTRNNIELTKKCVDSVRGQDISTHILVWDNDSSDGTIEWLYDNKIDSHMSYENQGVSRGWNRSLDYLLNLQKFNHVLVLNNDTVIPKWLYSELLSYDFPFVTGVGIGELIEDKPQICEPQPNPDFSAFLIRREAWDKIGKFDERMKIYCSDCDYHIRGHRLGVPMMKVNAPYYHINSQTMKRADPADREAIQSQASRDRDVFQSIYGCLPGTQEYNKLFK